MLKIAYLANQFPSPVEPYVSQEIDRLRRRGIEVVPCSGKKRRGDAESWAGTADPDLLCLQPISFLVMLKAVWLLLRRWKLILMTWPPDGILEFLVAETPQSAALRRCSPFCGILTPTEIASVWQRRD